ncbi:MAG: methyltransferase domain-containing protein [bacterium]|nr:methyltransferase domain-containing protein [bacterium]MCP5068765.1 methyltransferase domain-containing protein [bacterium]
MSGPIDRLRQMRRLASSMRVQLEVAVLRAGLDAGLFQALEEPMTPAELAEAKTAPLDLIAAWLRAAHAHGLLLRREGRFQPAPYVRWLMEGPDAEAARAMLDQTALTYVPLQGRLPALLRGEERPVFGRNPEEAIRVAIGARVTERAALSVLRRLPGVRDARRILDVGCGSGSYLADLLVRFRDALGTGVELDPAVAEQARTRLREAEVFRRCEILEGDFMALTVPRNAFDLVLLNNNLHYFDMERRVALLERIHGCLADGGTLAIQAPMVSGSVAARMLGARASMATFDLFLRAHKNLHGLPVMAELQAQLRDAGFTRVGDRPIPLGGIARYVWATKAGTR